MHAADTTGFQISELQSLPKVVIRHFTSGYVLEATGVKDFDLVVLAHYTGSPKQLWYEKKVNGSIVMFISVEALQYAREINVSTFNIFATCLIFQKATDSRLRHLHKKALVECLCNSQLPETTVYIQRKGENYTR